MAEQENSKDPDIPRPRFSSFTPFPYGSPLAKMNTIQTSFSGSPGQKLLLGSSLAQSQPPAEVMTPRLKGRDLYGGPVTFGSSARKTRLLSAGPYTAAFRNRAADKQTRLERVSLVPALGTAGPPPSSLPSTAPSSPHSSPGPASSPPAPLSSTARVILSTLEKLSAGGTPVTDARKIPLASPISASRVEKRKLLESELNCSLSSSPGRRRQRLGGGGLALALSGPPLRKNFSPSLNTSTSTGSTSSVPSTPATPVSTRPLSVPKPPEPAAPVPEPAALASLGARLSADNNAMSSSTKSSLKMKTKLSDSGRSRVEPQPAPAPPCPPVSAPQLKVDAMPVFNFTPAPAPSPPRLDNPPAGADKSPPRSPIPQDVLERNNNNKSPLKRQLNETEDKSESDSPKKMKPVPAPSPSPPLSTQSNTLFKDQISAPKDTIRPPKPSSAKTFSFSTPKSVIAAGSLPVSEAGKQYSFSLPRPVRPAPSDQLTNGPSGAPVVSVQSNASVPSFNFKSSTEPAFTSEAVHLNKKMMPDITNNTLRKTVSNDKLKGSNSNSGLPDVTASTGFGGFLPAKELKAGSVMDILGKNM